MNLIYNKLIIFLCCLGFSATALAPEVLIPPTILSIICTCLISYFNQPIFSLIISGIFIVVSGIFPTFIFFLPVIAYDFYLTKEQYIIGAMAIPLLLHYFTITGTQLLMLLILFAASFLLKKHTTDLENLTKTYTTMRDETVEFSKKLEIRNKELMEKQDYEVNLATLNERNRIAREIHDNIGHILSRSILQVGALIAITSDSMIKEQLTQLKDSLTDGMNSIRNSIHNIHEESVDLHQKLEGLLQDFTFCDTYLDYNITTAPNAKATYSIIYIVKEALSNIIKHSNATHVTISLIEQPAIYQIIIKDNGTCTDLKEPIYGMGMQSMQERVNTLGGILNINTEDGYKIFISIPIENKGDNHD